MVKVSVIIPTYNSAQYLTETIESVLSQTFSDYEIIIIDDASTDNTKEIVENFRRKFPNIIYKWQENQGVAVARNNGIKISHGEYIAFLDSDDIWSTDKLEEAIRVLEDNTEAGLVHTKVQNISENGDMLDIQSRGIGSLEGDIFSDIFYRNSNIATSSVVVRKAILVAGYYFDEKLTRLGCEDRDLWLNIAKDYPVKYIDQVHLYYRIRENSLSKNDENMLAGRVYVVNKYKKEFRFPRLASRKAISVIKKEIADSMFFNKNYKSALSKYINSYLNYPLAVMPLYNSIKCIVKIIHE